jgi:hypothetical protein
VHGCWGLLASDVLPGGLTRLGVGRHAREIPHHAGLVANHPRIVPRGNESHIARSQLGMGQPAPFQWEHLSQKQRALAATPDRDEPPLRYHCPSTLEISMNSLSPLNCPAMAVRAQTLPRVLPM